MKKVMLWFVIIALTASNIALLFISDFWKFGLPFILGCSGVFPFLLKEKSPKLTESFVFAKMMLWLSFWIAVGFALYSYTSSIECVRCFQSHLETLPDNPFTLWEDNVGTLIKTATKLYSRLLSVLCLVLVALFFWIGRCFVRRIKK